ncbi:sulfatase-like hydrolase/transferase [Stieleria sp. ICT_E10.1]|uniref:sulfatase-like hydrolase/transferase n=1 Tax=Stieleria sedimenti TaxID=2976331 RepID=UPI002180536D|nr:sulfatase-like hydrolase/transferase [Stieleria sedimenti]MCS7467918.1 sulfatase-like hydrolase/transferase [Stieleria sedimenti]
MVQFFASALSPCRPISQADSRQRTAALARLAVAALVLMQVWVACVANAATPPRPNIMLIMTDDQGWGDLGTHGNPILSTPTLDRLAGESVRLNRFYVSPVCAPTRAALLTGRYPERTGVAGVTGRREVMRAAERTMAERFRDAGYATGCFGKWHNGAQMPLHPNGQGFEEFFGFCGGHFNLYDDPLLERNGVPVQTKGYITDVLTDAAIEFLQTPREQPFFCYLPFNAPHGPFQVRQDLFDKYNTGEVSEKTAAVYAMVENIDDNVARLLNTLEQQGKTNDTIVLFLTDNGPNGKRFNGGMRGAKGSVHEGGCRVPCFIRWPGQIEPKRIEQITAHIDLLPTLAQWCGIPLEDSVALDGQSLVKLIQDGSDRALAERSILTYRPNQSQLETFGKAAVRTNQYRLTIENANVSLFDMHADPKQEIDVAEQHPETTERLKSEIEGYVDAITTSITQPRHVPVAKQRPTFIPSVDARLSGNPGFADNISWAHSWVDNWTSAADTISWPIDVAESGRYQITLHYVSNASNVSVSAAIADQYISTTLRRFDSESLVRPDLDSQSTPRRMLEFGQQSLGIVNISAGKTTLQLKRRQDGQMIELGGVTITTADLPSNEQFHLFLLAGQSNMAGRGKVTPADRVPDPRILMLDRDGNWVPATDPLHFDKSVAGVGLGRGFARRYASAHPDVTVGLVPCAVGGSPIAAWAPGGYHPQTKTHPYDDALRRIQTAMASGTFKGILWHQGESDCKPGLAEAYKSNLTDVMERFRSHVGAKTPIIIGGLAQRDFPQWTEHRKRVDQSHREVASELPASAFVESTGLTLKSDNTHFDRQSLLEFGQRYAEALAEIHASK